MGREMMGLLKKKCITSMLTEVISMPEIPTALTKLSHRHVQGKIVAAICR
jgi:D-arabinose 1-dehydrogenase-like Zn-dependent alcohol dehydrogenase